MATHATVSVQATATLIWRGSNPTGDNLILSTNGAGKDVHFGGSGVTTSSFGFRMANNTDAFAMSVPYGQSLYGVVSTGSGPLSVYCVDR